MCTKTFVEQSEAKQLITSTESMNFPPLSDYKGKVDEKE